MRTDGDHDDKRLENVPFYYRISFVFAQLLEQYIIILQ